MTKMTMLHFASPFAFSMPAPAQPADRSADGALPRSIASGPTAASQLRSTDALADAGVSWAEATEASPDGEGFAANTFDTALRRYLEQQAFPAGSEAVAPEPQDDLS